MKHQFAICLAAFMIAGCSGRDKNQADNSPKPETLIEEYDEAAMDAAIGTARNRVDDFLKILAENGADSFSVKAAIQDGDETEHFWIVNVSYAEGVFSGEIGNDPGIVKNVKAGQAWKVKKDEISDWMYTKGDLIHGGFTIDPLLGSFPKDKADALRSKLVR
ncbi:MAG: DUF2314 domain-containing protein [Verrucomicrobiota bacterium]